jgi:hypothetical protein
MTLDHINAWAGISGFVLALLGIIVPWVLKRIRASRAAIAQAEHDAANRPRVRGFSYGPGSDGWHRVL